MKNFILDQTDKPAAGFRGERIVFETMEIGPVAMIFQGYRVAHPLEGYVLYIKEQGPSHEYAEAYWSKTLSDFREALRRAVATAKTFQALFPSGGNRQGNPFFN